MVDTVTMIYLVLMFIGMYMFFFFIILIFKNKDEMFDYPRRLKDYSISIVVPCYNEEKSIGDTINSLLKSNYPGLKKIIIVDDCSKDNSYEIIKRFAAKYPQIMALRTPKNTGNAAGAKNYGAKFVKTELIGFSDADSFPDEGAVAKMVGYFNDQKVGAVTSAVFLRNKTTFLAKLQTIEYIVMAWTRKLLDFIDSVYVTNGPLSIYRKNLFDKVGGFDEGSITEDIEITWHILSLGYKTKMCLSAFVLTNAPQNFRVWYKQRERWGMGGIATIIKYRKDFLRKGMFGFFVIPFVSVSIILSISVFLFGIYLLARYFFLTYLSAKYSFMSNTTLVSLQTVNLHPSVLLFFTLVLFATGFIYSRFILMTLGTKKNDWKEIGKLFNRLFYLLVYLTLYPIVWFSAIYRLIKRDYRWR
jgi:cellulose synthase/poly-beta-1,6-N-acetylglucosamine synthase-like glycosyltransferase